MSLRVLISLALMLSVFQLNAQSVIGLTKDEVREVIKKEHKDFIVDNMVVKKVFNYLKYVNKTATITYIIYFSDNDIATSTKMVCDYSEYDFVRDDLNQKYTRIGNNKWEYEDENGEYSVELQELDWYFTVRERKKVNGVPIFETL